jgi:hypothetical protein
MTLCAGAEVILKGAERIFARSRDAIFISSSLTYRQKIGTVAPPGKEALPHARQETAVSTGNKEADC